MPWKQHRKITQKGSYTFLYQISFAFVQGVLQGSEENLKFSYIGQPQ